ncbi:MAG: DNA methylase [Acidimicrobiia bacterium]|nr:DNA methylase [Acidimicrobiia bacterium]
MLALLDEFGDRAKTVHDPFAGAGTTVVVSAFSGRLSTYCEINPFMRLVIDTKTTGVREAVRSTSDLSFYLRRVAQVARTNLPAADDARNELASTFGDKNYFELQRLRELIALRRAITEMDPEVPAFRGFAQLALASIVVDSSELIRAGDVRYRRPRELERRIESPLTAFEECTAQFVTDLSLISVQGMAKAELLTDSALDTPTSAGSTDLVITSPPYLNGTNYFRNTKLELWATGLLQHESELGEYRTQAVAAGINNVSSRGRDPRTLPFVEGVATELDMVAYDRRIPELVRRYFSDAYDWLKNVYMLLHPRGHALVDIGDSRFAGVLVKTDRLLTQVAQEVGLELTESRVLRKRRSKDGSPLEQVLLVFRRPAESKYSASSRVTFRAKAKDFAATLPHQEQPLSARNWGHGWHSLCSYQGKLKPAIAHILVKEFTTPGEVVLDPMSGAGTIPLEACLQGRRGWGNDLLDLAFILTRAKVGHGEHHLVRSEADKLISWIKDHRAGDHPTVYSDFGMNGRLPDYFHPDTYREILAAREYICKHPVDTWERAVVYGSLLHILHGNRPYALSRRSHPVTPFKPTGDSEYRSIEPRLMAKIERTLGQGWPSHSGRGRAFQSDLFDLPFWQEIDAIITSPPFAGSTRFYVANWMRLWMTGWEPSDFDGNKTRFIEYRQRTSLDVYSEFFAACHRWLRPDGRLIMHVGRNGKWDMATELGPMARKWFDVVYSFDESVVGREKFGIRDQGGTRSHQYLFMVRA